MGPEKNPMALKLAAEAIPRIAEEQHSQEMAASVLAKLSSAMESYPVQSPVVEPTLLPKLHALGKINIDPLGVAGPNPMQYVDWGQHGDVTIKAFVAPAHDVFRDNDSNYQIATRILLLRPPESARSYEAEDQKDELKFFGINLFIQDPVTAPIEEEPIDLDEETARQKLLTAIERTEKKELIVIDGIPVTGETNIFAVRHKKHGIVKFYSTTIKSNDNSDFNAIVAGLGEVRRVDDRRVVVSILNDLVVEVMQVTTDNPAYEDILNEFESSISSLEATRVADHTKLLTPEEVAAIRRSLSLGKSPLEILSQLD